jgi:hypothetical protein
LVVGKSADGGGYIDVVAVREGSLKVKVKLCMCKPGTTDRKMPGD